MSVVELSIVVPVYNTGNLVEKSLLPLFEDECVNKARRRWRGRPRRGRKREILWA